MDDEEKTQIIMTLNRWPRRRGYWAFDDGLWYNDKEDRMTKGCPAVVLQTIRGQYKPHLLDELEELALECGLNSATEFCQLLDRNPSEIATFFQGTRQCGMHGSS